MNATSATSPILKEAKSTNFASQVFEALEYATNTRFQHSSNITIFGNEMFTQILDPTLNILKSDMGRVRGHWKPSSTRCSTPNTIQLNDEFSRP
ncbi:hypothetical protein DSO57_1039463 [Entomophthora muscae]|uniref:Uncharacterized protein n=1 Tax=Entomophthora muscae TaxID=34485 RepID=A0ACC2SYP8_9FUNG|nr:hypothetical protein DSO57_1039463 [Entomophthora muscae]